MWLERPAVPRARFELLQKWEGFVVKIQGDSFVARLTDLTDPARVEEEATFDIREISDGDTELFEPGAVFYLSLYLISVSGQKTRAAQFRFRRVPAWSRAAIARIDQRASEMHDVLGHFE